VEKLVLIKYEPPATTTTDGGNSATSVLTASRIKDRFYYVDPKNGKLTSQDRLAFQGEARSDVKMEIDLTKSHTFLVEVVGILNFGRDMIPDTSQKGVHLSFSSTGGAFGSLRRCATGIEETRTVSLPKIISASTQVLAPLDHPAPAGQKQVLAPGTSYHEQQPLWYSSQKMEGKGDLYMVLPARVKYGYAFVNQRLLGGFFGALGPQKTLLIPGCFLDKESKENKITILAMDQVGKQVGDSDSDKLTLEFVSSRDAKALTSRASSGSPEIVA